MRPARVFAIATNVFREVIRDRVLYLLVLFGLLMTGTSRLLPEVSSVASDKILVDLGLAAIAVLGVVVAVFVGTGLINKEIEKRTVLVLLAKPMGRGEFIVGKHLGLSAVLAVLVGGMGVMFFVFMALNHITVPMVTIVGALGFEFLQLVLLTAIALTFGVAMSSLLATLLSLGLYLIGNLSPDLVKLAKLTQNEGLQQMIHSLYLVLPDFSRLNFRNEAVYGLLPPAPELLTSGLYALFYTSLCLGLATLLFARREF
jgi:Cu-processing system permease protein